jgi:hypothetical protein
MKTAFVPLIPTPEVVRRYLAKWDGLENYKYQEKSLNLLFQQFSPSNRRLDHVLLKVSALNDFYSTNIYDTFTVARHIRSLGMDRRLREGDPTLVNDVALIENNGKTRNHYSFVSKYCNHHNPEPYPIFDSFVEKMLWHYSKVDGFLKFRRGALRDYKEFVGIIMQFRKSYGLGRFSLRQIDIFLWLCGKECFPNNYSKA